MNKVFLSKKNREIVLKRAEASHSKGWREGIIEVSKEKYFLLVEPELIYSEEEIEKRIKACSNIENHLLLAAEDKKRLIGLIHAFRKSPKKIHHTAEFDIWILKEYRNEGIGREMIFYVEDWAKSNKIEKIKNR